MKKITMIISLMAFIMLNVNAEVNLFTNPGFESGFSPYYFDYSEDQVESGYAITGEVGEVFEGDSALEIMCISVADSVSGPQKIKVQQAVSGLTVGDSYIFIYKLKGSSAGGFCRNAVTGIANVTGTSFSVADTYGTYSHTFVADSSVMKVFLQFCFSQNDGMSFFTDDWTLLPYDETFNTGIEQGLLSYFFKDSKNEATLDTISNPDNVYEGNTALEFSSGSTAATSAKNLAVKRSYYGLEVGEKYTFTVMAKLPKALRDIEIAVEGYAKQSLVITEDTVLYNAGNYVELEYVVESLGAADANGAHTVWVGVGDGSGIADTVFFFDNWTLVKDGGVATAIEKVEQDNHTITIFPSIASHTLQLSGNDAQLVNYRIFNLNGREMLTGASDSSIDVSNLSPGCYLIQLGNSVSKFVKK